MRLCVLLAALCVCLCTALDEDGPNTDSILSKGAVNRVLEKVEEVKEKIADQEALLGGKEARHRLINLPTEQAKQELKKLVSRIDTDGNGRLSPKEMADWMLKVELEFEAKEVEKKWEEADKDKDGFVTLEEYAQTISLEDDPTSQMDELEEMLGMSRTPADDSESPQEMEQILAQSRVLFNQADMDKDDRLTREEFDAFMNPQSHTHMLEVLVQTYREHFDTDGDGFISYDEYMAIYMPQSSEEDDEPPEWAESEKEEFENVLDKNKDGKLDLEEMKVWVASDDIEMAQEEADHLLQMADKDGDGELSVEEVLEEFDLFMDSQLTDFGHAQVGHDEVGHDEL